MKVRQSGEGWVNLAASVTSSSAGEEGRRGEMGGGVTEGKVQEEEEEGKCKDKER